MFCVNDIIIAFLWLCALFSQLCVAVDLSRPFVYIRMSIKMLIPLSVISTWSIFARIRLCVLQLYINMLKRDVHIHIFMINWEVFCSHLLFESFSVCNNEQVLLFVSIPWGIKCKNNVLFKRYLNFFEKILPVILRPFC